MEGVLLTDKELSEWIFDLTTLCKSGKEMRRRFDFDDPQSVTPRDYETLIGYTKENFEEVFDVIKPYINSSANRSRRNALAIFWIILRHGLSQVHDFFY